MHETRVLANIKHCPLLHTVQLEKPEEFSFVAGQFVILESHIDEKRVRRSYTIASAPHEKQLDITLKEQEFGVFSPYLCALKEDDSVKMLGPFGRFTLPEDDAPLVFLAAGTGITPFISFLRDMAQRKDTRAVTLVYAAPTPDQLLRQDEFEEMKDSLNLTTIYSITRPHETELPWDGRTGRITPELLEEIGVDANAWYFICGPTPMVGAVQAGLIRLDVPPSRVKTEKYGKVVA